MRGSFGFNFERDVPDFLRAYLPFLVFFSECEEDNTRTAELLVSWSGDSGSEHKNRKSE